jgi:hypothetical protein
MESGRLAVRCTAALIFASLKALNTPLCGAYFLSVRFSLGNKHVPLFNDRGPPLT